MSLMFRESKYRSKRDDKQRDGWNVSWSVLKALSFHLETFIDKKDDVFLQKKERLIFRRLFLLVFGILEIYEFEVRGDNGISMYQKKIIKVLAHRTLKDAEPFLEPKK